MLLKYSVEISSAKALSVHKTAPLKKKYITIETAQPQFRMFASVW